MLCQKQWYFPGLHSCSAFVDYIQVGATPWPMEYMERADLRGLDADWEEDCEQRFDVCLEQ